MVQRYAASLVSLSPFLYVSLHFSLYIYRYVLRAVGITHCPSGLRGAISFALMTDFVGADAHTVKSLTDATILVVMITNFVLGGLTLPLLKVLGLTPGSAHHTHAADEEGKPPGSKGGGAQGSNSRHALHSTFLTRMDILPKGEKPAESDPTETAEEMTKHDADAALQVRRS